MMSRNLQIGDLSYHYRSAWGNKVPALELACTFRAGHLISPSLSLEGTLGLVDWVPGLANARTPTGPAQSEVQCEASVRRIRLQELTRRAAVRDCLERTIIENRLNEAFSSPVRYWTVLDFCLFP